MIWLLSFLVVCLICIIALQNRKSKKHAEELHELTLQVQQLSTPILVMTNNQHLQTLLAELNAMLVHHESCRVQFQRSEEAFKKMLANISHDLRTPLTVVLGYIETIQNDSQMDKAEQQRLLSNIHHKTGEIIQLMNSFFDLAKLEAGDVDFSLERVNVNEVCRTSILSFYDLIQAADMEVVIEIPDTPIYTLATEQLLERVLNNLLSNALNYGQAGKLIGIQLLFTDQRLTIEVWDRGQGIAETEQNKVFERLFTLNESRNKSFQGSGLGLTITKRLVEAMGGTIRLESEPFKKTSFTVELKRFTF